MARTIVYSRTVSPSPPRSDVDFDFREPPNAKISTPLPPLPPEAPVRPPDDYKDKIAKYVPAEVLAFFTPMAAMLEGRANLLIITAVAGLVATPGYLWSAARNLPEADKPLPHFYVLAAVSFLVWASATTSLGSFVGLDRLGGSVLLGVTVFLVPLIDSIFVYWRGKRVK